MNRDRQRQTWSRRALTPVRSPRQTGLRAGRLQAIRGRVRPLVVSALFGMLLAASAAADPRTDYMLNCRGCHGPDGAGAPGAAPDLRGQLGRFLTVAGGREYLVRVPGTSQSELDDARTAALLNWMLHEFSAGEVPKGFMPYTGEEVARVRRPALADPQGARRVLLEAIERSRSEP
jgi:mono/diheme cytochrome c family protein